MGLCQSQSSQQQPILSITPSKNRSCTDTPILFGYSCLIAFTVYITIQAVDKGDPNRLSVDHGIDMYGRTCGISENVTDLPFAAWPFPISYDYMICVSSCNDTTTDIRMALPLESTPFLGYCLPDPSSVINSNITSEFSSENPYLTETSRAALSAIGDIYTAWPVIVASIPLTLILALAYLIFIQIFAGTIIWGIILSIIIGGVLGSYVLLSIAKSQLNDSNDNSDQAHAMQYTAYVLLAITALFTIMIFALRKRIYIAVAVIVEASKALSSTKSMIFFPIIPLISFLTFLAGWLVVALYMCSVGSYTSVDTPSDVLVYFGTNNPTPNPTISLYFEWNSSFRAYFVLHIFLLLWTTQAFIYATYTILSGSVADWYFTPHQPNNKISLEQKSTNNNGWVNPPKGTVILVQQHQDPSKPAPKPPIDRKITRFPVLSSMSRTLRKHFGTILFAALVIAIIQFIRGVVSYIQRYTKARKNRLQKTIFACVKTTLYCVQCCLDKVNRNALIWTAIWGDNFCHSVVGSFKLIWANLFRVAAINLVGSFLLFLGKVMISLSTTGLALLFLYYDKNIYDKLQSAIAPCLVILALSYCLACLFMIVFETCIDTVFLCFLVDCEWNEKSGCMIAPPSLQKLIDSHAPNSKLQADKLVN